MIIIVTSRHLQALCPDNHVGSQSPTHKILWTEIRLTAARATVGDDPILVRLLRPWRGVVVGIVHVREYGARGRRRGVILSILHPQGKDDSLLTSNLAPWTVFQWVGQTP